MKLHLPSEAPVLVVDDRAHLRQAHLIRSRTELLTSQSTFAVCCPYEE